MMAGLNNAERFDAKGRTVAEQRNVATVRTIFEGLSRGDFSVLYSNLAADGSVWIVGFTPERLPKKARNPNFFPELFCNGMQFDIKQVAVDGNLIVVEWEDDCITKDGKKYENTGCSLFTFNDDGKLSSYREYIDPEKFFAIL
jgi:ketosteroid isomerase-like protein